MKKTSSRSHRRFGLLASVAIVGALAPWVQSCQDSSEAMPVPASIIDLEAATYQTVTTHVPDDASDAAPSELSWEWEYDSEDRLTETMGPGGVVTRVSYTASGAESSEDGDASARRVFVRDEYGRLLRATSSDDEMSFRYYTTGLPAEVHSDGAPVIHYTYDVEGRLTELRIGNAATIRYRYDYLGRPAVVTTPVGDITYTYQRGSNMVVRELPNGVRTLREYDDEGKLIELTHVDADDYVIAEFVYRYRPDGLIDGIVETTQRAGERACRYDYDPMHRLIGVECQSNEQSYRYGYDDLGNLAEAQIVGAPPLRLESAPTGALIADSRGEVRVDSRGHIRRLPGASEAIDYDFNPAGDLAGARAQSLQYRYNALGLLTGRSVDGQETTYLPDPFADAWRPLWQRSPDGQEAVVIWDGAVPLLELEGDEVRFRLEDHLGSVRAELDGSGSITAWHDYSPFGAPVEVESGSSGLRPGFAGLYWDSQAQVYHAMARAYDPVTARFLQPDPQLRVPEASKLSHSLYAYGGGDPVNFVDRNGAQAREFEPARFNPTIRWWDSYLRALDFHTFGGVRKLLGNADAPLVVNTAPDIRNSVVERILDIARAEGGTLQDLHNRVSGWRWNMVERGVRKVGNGYSFRPPELRGVPGREFITETEWQAAENYVTALKRGSRDGWAKTSLQIVGWRGARYFLGATLGFRPSGVLRAVGLGPIQDTPDSWIAQTSGTRGWQWKGVRDAQRLARGSPTLLQRIDDFLVRPSYGDEIPATAGPLPPSPVGGVYLSGAGAALEGLGELKGVAIDELTGRLVLIGSNDQKTNLPPLRLGDIVTVFRAVYDHGQSPSVTIDPDEQNPMGPIMHVKHGPGTEWTYVGWILFESDRIMKTYQLGEDNVTREVVSSQVPGHSETLDLVFFGDTLDQQADSTWERFWIVPAALNRFDASGGVSLFELPLKVNTQKMRWENGKLVDDPDAESSVGAMAFTTWFSEHFDEIADEVLLTPPEGSGLAAPVAVFHELRRIAVIAAVAERLRDLGQTMPVWMRDYAVAPFPVPATTPSLTLEKSQDVGSSVRVASIYGGVNLAPADNDVRVYREEQVADATSVHSEDLPFINSSSHEAQTLTISMPELRMRDALGKVNTIALPGGGGSSATALSALVLPGANSRALGPNRQQVTDVDVPIGVGRSIQLTRFYNSFFDPSGAFGRGWTLDLPRLLMTQVPVARDGKQSQYRVVPQLSSPLGSWDIRFDQRERVEPFGVEMSVAQGHPEIAGITGGQNEILNAATHQVLFHDGTQWHFDDAGWLLLIQRDGTATRYVRDSVGRITQIAGYLGTNVVADISLAYDQLGRIVEATAAQADYLEQQAPAVVSNVHFEYSEDGRLAEVTRPAGNQGESAEVEHSYSYEVGRLAKIQTRQMNLSFAYDDRAQLLWQEQDGTRTDYAVSATEQGTVFTHGTAGAEGGEWTYDARMRPTRADLGGGETLEWEYGPSGAVVETVSRAGEPILTRTTSQDGRTETVAVTDGPTYTTIRDPQGRPAGFSIDDVPAAELSWGADGTLQSLRTTGTEVQPRRHEGGWPNGVLISAPMESGRTTQWLEEEWDVMGRPTKITDSSGFEYIMEYDDQGRLRTYGRLTEDGNLMGANLVYDSSGLITDIQSSWEKEQRQYGDDGVLRRVERERQGVTSVATFDARGREATRSAFDGGTTTWRYDSDAAEASLSAIELPNMQRIDYVSGGGSTEAPSRGISLGPASVNTVSDHVGRVIKLTWGGRR